MGVLFLLHLCILIIVSIQKEEKSIEREGTHITYPNNKSIQIQVFNCKKL
jgi:competence transcription factor ComK